MILYKDFLDGPKQCKSLGSGQVVNTDMCIILRKSEFIYNTETEESQNGGRGGDVEENKRISTTI